jgi:betaine-aldehyde dehydrogenase
MSGTYLGEKPVNAERVTAEGTPDGADTLFIGGRWIVPQAGETRAIHCPADGSFVGLVAEAGEADTVAAIKAAGAAHDAGLWSSVPEPERGDLLLAVARRLRERKDEFARAESLDTGKTPGRIRDRHG